MPIGLSLIARLADRHPITTVSGYLPIRGEIDPRPLMRALAAAGLGLCLPALSTGAGLIFRRWHFGDPLNEGRFGLKEPSPRAEARLPDVLLVPLVAFDEKGRRLGYGAGHFDATLRALRKSRPVTAIGVAYVEQKVDTVPEEPQDERLDFVVTPAGFFACGD